LLFFGGLGAIPFIEDIEDLIQSWTGENIRNDIAELTGKWAIETLYGFPGSLGFDITGSLGTEIPSSITDLIGVPYQWVKKGKYAYEDIRVKDWQRLIEDFPLQFQVFGYPAAAYRYRTRGLETRAGKPITGDEGEQIKLTKKEAIGKGMGFQPVKVSEHYRAEEARRKGAKFYEDKRDDLLTAYARAINAYGDNSVQEQKAQARIDKYNDTLPDWAIHLRITSKTLRSRLAFPRPTRKEEMLKEKFPSFFPPPTSKTMRPGG